MTVRANPYFSNSGDLEQGLNNLASMFAPPASSDMANWSLARERNQKSDIVAQLSKDPRYQDFDYQSLLGGAIDSWQDSERRLSMDDATARRGQDITAQTDIQKSLLAPISEGATRFVPPSIADQYELPDMQFGNIGAAQGEQITTPDGRTIFGAPKLISATEWEAMQNQRLVDSGQITDQMLIDLVMGDDAPVMVAGPDGPVYSNPGAALGQPAYVNPGTQPKPTNAVAQLKDGSTVPAIQGADGVWKHAQTGAPLPADIQIFDTAKPQGTAADVGLGKPAQNYIDRALIDLTTARSTASTLRDLISESPASQGAVGFLRGTAQDAMQVGGELGQFFGGGVAEVAKAIDAGLADASLAENFDPNIPSIDMLANLLAFQYAKTTTGERLSNEMLRSSRAALGLDGPMANQASAIARLDQAIEQMRTQESILRTFRANGTSGPAPEGPTGDVPEGVDPEDWEYMTPEQRALFQ